METKNNVTITDMLSRAFYLCKNNFLEILKVIGIYYSINCNFSYCTYKLIFRHFHIYDVYKSIKLSKHYFINYRGWKHITYDNNYFYNYFNIWIW